jgi:hypothetical protein
MTSYTVEPACEDVLEKCDLIKTIDSLTENLAKGVETSRTPQSALSLK